MTAPRVLVIEPEHRLNAWLAATLGNAGFYVSVAFDAPSGAAMACSYVPDLIVLESASGPGGGAALARHLRDQLPNRAVGVIYLVGPQQLGHFVRDQFFGLDDFVLCPPQPLELVGRLHRMAQRVANLPNVVAELGQFAGRLPREGAARRSRVTVMFADVRGFTGISETRDPESVAAATNNLLAQLAASVIRFGGAIDKFLGDGMMVLFGLDDQSADHELASAYAAQDIMDTLHETDAASLFTGVQLELGVGLHTGDVVVGPVGPPFRRDVTAIGDTVNNAARICGEAGAGEILVSAVTYRPLEGRVLVHDVRDVYVKGKRFAQRLYSVGFG